jgi:hypothetical protein
LFFEKQRREGSSAAQRTDERAKEQKQCSIVPLLACLVVWIVAVVVGFKKQNACLSIGGKNDM